MKTLVAQTQFTISHLDNAYTVLLSNEVQQFATNSSRVPTTNASYYTDVTIYYGTQKREDFTVGTVASANGITVTKSGSRVTFTVNTGTTISTDSGTFTIPITIDGKSFSKIFSWSCAKQGQTGSTGAAAKSVDITATSQIFKSTDGGATFSPDTIKLTPIFQGGISFSKWQYSTNGGTSWTDVTSGSNGLTISSGVLTIAKTCSLFTGSVTSLSFKCISNNATYFDVMTVLKLYDVTDIQIGGRNLLLHSKMDYIPTGGSGTITHKELIEDPKHGTVLHVKCQFIYQADYLKLAFTPTIGDKYLITFFVKSANSSTLSSVIHSGQTAFSNNAAIRTTTEWEKCTAELTIQSIPEGTPNLYFYPSNDDYWIKDIKIERGNKATDWTPAPEDIEEQFTAVTDTVKTAQSKIDAVEGKITNKVWRSDVITIQDSEGNIREKTLVDHLVQNMIDSNGITNTVQDIKTDLGNPNDPAAGTSIYSKITKAQQTADKFTWLVKSGDSSSSMTLTDSFLSILARDIDITGKVTFNSFDSATKTQIQTAVNKVDNWSYDSTSIDGGKIYTGTITADKIASNSITSDKIAAGAITSDKIIIGDFTNYATINPNFPETMLPNTFIHGGTSISGSFVEASGRDYFPLCEATPNAFSQGEKISYSFTAKTDGGQVPISVSLLCYSSITKDSSTGVTTSGTLVKEYTSTPEGGYSGYLNGYPKVCTGVIEISDSLIDNAKYFILAIKNMSSQRLPIYIMYIKFNRKIDGSIIVDGGITAECLAVDSIRSRNYTAGSGTYSTQGTMFNLEGSGYIKSQNFAITSTGTAYFRGTINATSGTIGSTSSGWQISGNTIKGLSSTSKIISGVLESSNYIADTQGVRIDLNTGIINGDIRANNMSALNSYRIHDSIHESTIITAAFGMDSDVSKIVVFGFQEPRDSPNSNYAGTAYMATYDFDDGHSKVEIVSDMINLVTDNLGGAVNCEMVSANGGRCWKFTNGLAIAVKSVSVQTASPTSYGNMYYGNLGAPLGNMPITFKNIFYRNITYDSGGTEWLVWYPGDYTKWSGTIFPYSPVKTTANSARDLRAVCIGTWK